MQPTPEQAALLHQTMREYTDAFNAVCQVADTEKISNGVELHRLTYGTIRATTHLPSQLICAARVKATEAIKAVMTWRRKQVKREETWQTQGKAITPLSRAKTPHSALCALRYDARSFRFDRQRRLASLVHVQQQGQARNRALIAVNVPTYYEQYLTASWQQESADLLFRKETFWLHVVVSCALPTIVPTPQNTTVGIDPGINRLAVTSQPRYFGSKRLKETNHRSFRLRRSLQAKGTKSAKRHLKKVAGKLKRFQADANHVVAKQIVASLTPGDTLAMENLTDIGEWVKGRRTQRRAMSNWSFAQLQEFLAYKAAYRSITVEFVDARYSSLACSRCGHREKRNRVCQSVFSCKKCGYSNNADENAAYNLAIRATRVARGPTAKRPIVSCVRAEGQAPLL